MYPLDELGEYIIFYSHVMVGLSFPLYCFFHRIIDYYDL
jgi:hypothetical protein